MLDLELLKLINSKLGISGYDSFTKLMSLTSEEYRGGFLEKEHIFFILLSRKYSFHSENFLSIKCNDKNYFIGFSSFKDSNDIENICFVEKQKQNFIQCNTVMKLNIALFVEMLGESGLNLNFIPSKDSCLLDFEKYYVSLFPEDI